MNILLIGHACSPRAGSEPSFTWNWAWLLSRRHQITVLAYPHDRRSVETFLAENPNANLNFQWVTLPPIFSSWTFRNDGMGIQSPTLYLMWQRLAYMKAIELCERVGFDIVHHVSYGSVSSPPPAWKLPVPLVWGPIGGAQRTPYSFRSYFGRAWASEAVRNIRIRLFRFFPPLRRAAKSSAVVLATNRETCHLLTKSGARNVRLFLDSGIPPHFNLRRDRSKSDSRKLTLLWVGRMQRRKALPLALEALAQVRDLDVKLLIAGDGEMRESWEQSAVHLKLENNIDFLGRVPWQEMPRLYQSVDAFVFTSLRDSFGTQVLEAMSYGLPILTLDHQGVGTFVPDDAGIKVRVTTPEQTSVEVADGIRRLALFPEERRKMGESAQAYAETQTWEKRAEHMSKIYEEVLERSMHQDRRSSSFRSSSFSADVNVRLGEPASYGSYAVNKRIGRIDENVNLQGMKVLDIGCGNGCYTEELAQRANYVCGIDIHLPHITSFKESISRVQGVAENLPFASESFDAVTMIEVLEHTACETEVLIECFRVLKPGGLLILFAPNKLYPFESHPCRLGSRSIGRHIPFVSWLPASLRRHICYARIYSRRRLFQMVEKAGFQNQEFGYIFPPVDSFPLPFKRTYRRAASWLEKSPLGIFGVSIYAVFTKAACAGKNRPIAPASLARETPEFEVLGVRTHAVQIDGAITQMQEWINGKEGCHTVAATSMHGIVEAQHDPAFKQILNTTDLVVPDGMPLVWMGRRRKHDLPRRVYGPELMIAFCEKTAGKSYRHFFYGGEPGVAEQLAETLKKRFPCMQIAGTYSPPFRTLTEKEDAEVVRLISRAAADIVWVGLGAPKQERWMHEHRNKVCAPLLVSVGAAFNILSGRRRQAPRWMRENGLEWLFRLLQEPNRLWRRYLIYGTQFVAYIALDGLRLANFGPYRQSGRPFIKGISRRTDSEIPAK